MKIAIPQSVSQPTIDYLMERGYELIFGSNNPDPAVMAQEVAGADAILARTNPFPPEVLAAAPELKVIGRHGVGVDNIPLEYCRERGIRVTNAPTSNAISVAEHAVGMMIGAAHHFSMLDSAVRSGNWAIRNGYAGCDLNGKTLGIVGMGRIGSLVAGMCHAAFGMDVICYGGHMPVEDYPAGSRRVETLDEVLTQADFLSLHVPSTPQTKNMINAETLSQMKPTAILINCARGDVVDLSALQAALESGKLYGAALDVMPQEPPEGGHPLFGVKNVLFTPHTAALTRESMDRMGLHAAMGIDDVLNGRAPEWPVV